VELGLKGKVALVAGSSKGLGRAIAEELGAEGCNLVICARTDSAVRAAADELAHAHGVRTKAVTARLGVPGEADRLVGEALGAFGRVDILVTNAGGPPSGPFERISREAWQEAVHTLLDSAVDLARAVLPGMKERRWGRILNITSISVKQPVENLVLSNSIRAAVTGFARTLANEVASFGITVNNLLPGYTRTERVDELAAATSRMRGTEPQAIFAEWERQIPMGRLGEPRELAALAAFLASDRAGYITGTSIPVDGGWIKGLL
jgi:3-oxoacyl-[acyl-carrier protein] reductase